MAHWHEKSRFNGILLPVYSSLLIALAGAWVLISAVVWMLLDVASWWYQDAFLIGFLMFWSQSTCPWSSRFSSCFSLTNHLIEGPGTEASAAAIRFRWFAQHSMNGYWSDLGCQWPTIKLEVDPFPHVGLSYPLFTGSQHDSTHSSHDLDNPAGDFSYFSFMRVWYLKMGYSTDQYSILP